VLEQADQPMRLMEITDVTNVAALLRRMRTDGQAEYVVLGPYRHWKASCKPTA
jgi:hypothetical protein